MAKKTYKTFSLKGLQILLFDDLGRQMEVNFRAGAQIDSTAKFTTSDEAMQEALEKCSSYGRDFYLESVREETSAPVAEPKAEAVAEETSAPKATDKAVEETVTEDGIQKVKVADKAEAIEWLKENYPEKEYTSVKLRAKAAFDAACQECGVKFEMANA